MEASSYINALEEFFREEYIKEIERLAQIIYLFGATRFLLSINTQIMFIIG